VCAPVCARARVRVCVCDTTRSIIGIPKDLEEAEDRKRGQSLVTMTCYMIVQLESVNTGRKNRKAIEDKQNRIAIKHYMKLLNPNPEVRSCGRVENVFFSPLPPTPRNIKSI